MSHVYGSSVHVLQKYNLVLSSILGITSPSYIVGLAYYELGGKTINVDISATIPSNTALVIALYKAYNRNYSRQCNATINIVGSGRKNIKAIIWATYRNRLLFFSNSVNKQVTYLGYNKGAVNKVAQNEFGKDADVVYSSYRSPVNINVLHDGKY